MQKVDWIATTILLITHENTLSIDIFSPSPNNQDSHNHITYYTYRLFIVIFSPSPNNQDPLYRVSHVVKVKHAPPLRAHALTF